MNKCTKYQKHFNFNIGNFSQIAVMVVTAAVFGVGCYGAVLLKPNFDFNLFLPPDSDANKYNIQRSKVIL